MLYPVIFILSLMFINAILFFTITSKRIISEYKNPMDEYHTKHPHSLGDILVWPIFDIFHCRKKHRVVMGSFTYRESPILFVVYYDRDDKRFSLGASKIIHNSMTYPETLNRINSFYEHTPDLRLKLTRMVQLLYHYDRANFSTDMRLHEHVLNSSHAIKVTDNERKTLTIN